MDSYILFFKLYFLAHHRCYINYMEEAKLLAEWLCEEKLEAEINEPMNPIITIMMKGPFISYEIQELARITNIKLRLAIAVAFAAIDDLLRYQPEIDFYDRHLRS